MINHFLLFIVLMSALFSCQSAESQRRSTEQYYTSSGVEKFYLSDIPKWLDYSSTGQCFRQSDIRFMDLPKLMGQFNYDYPQAIQFQLLLNRLRREKMQEVRSAYLMLKDEEIVFYDTVDKIENKIYPFAEIKYDRIHLVWIDPALSSELQLKKLQVLLQSEAMNVGFPVLVSLCLDAHNLNDFVSKTKIYEGVGRIPFDLFSVYSTDKKHRYQFSLELAALFDQKKQLHLYLPQESAIPSELIGQFKIHRY